MLAATVLTGGCFGAVYYQYVWKVDNPLESQAIENKLAEKAHNLKEAETD